METASEGGRYHVRALDRSLALLRALNRHNGLIATELSRIVDLPRPTVLRLLKTLGDAGYVTRSETDGQYRATRQLRDLSCGYQEDTWLSSVVKPFLAELEAQLVWPLALIRLDGQALVVDAVTDHSSQIVERRDAAGMEVRPLSSSAAYLYMALLPEPERSEYKAHVLASETSAMADEALEEAELQARIERAGRDGYAILHRETHSAVAVPCFCEGRIHCTIVMRMHGTIEARRRIMPRYVENLLSAAKTLSQRIEEGNTIIEETQAAPSRAKLA